MNFFKFLISFFFGLFFFTGCSGSELKSEEAQRIQISKNGKYSNYRDFFYPTNLSSPKIYAFRDDAAPLDERFFRIYTLMEEGDSVFVIEKYNSIFRIFEGVSMMTLENFPMTDHMKVDKNGIKRSSRIYENHYFPEQFDQTVTYLVNYPSHLDSVSMVYVSKKTIIEDGIFMDVMGDEVEAILIVDSIKVVMTNVLTKQSSLQRFVAHKYFAKGIGLVQWGTPEGDVQYSLQKILSDNWWMENAQ
ncbi:MAG: hypothetical protein JJT77_03170 [Crocinitomicaceae bacterium]|nr:hypothetical protein [Crocinitomicaceae bacterium]